MGFVFRKSIKIAPGLHLNVNKRGMGVSVGGRNTPRVSVNSEGRVTSSARIAPGLRYQKTTSLNGRKKGATKDSPELNVDQLTADNESQLQESLELTEPRNLWLPHSIWSVLFFAFAGYISGRQTAYPAFTFLLAALGVAFLITWAWNSLNKNQE